MGIINKRCKWNIWEFIKEYVMEYCVRAPGRILRWKKGFEVKIISSSKKNMVGNKTSF